MKKYAFNRVASDKVSLKRQLPDVRHAECKTIDYDEDLPKVSVIIIFNNEMLSALLRTVWSVLRMTPEKYLQEVVLVKLVFFPTWTRAIINLCSYVG